MMADQSIETSVNNEPELIFFLIFRSFQATGNGRSDKSLIDT